MYIIYIYIYIYIRLNSVEWGKTLVNTTNFPTSFCRGRSQGACCLYDFENRCYNV